MLHWLFFSIEKGVNSLGKNIKGKECGKGIFQRKDGWYIARFVDKYGTRHEKYFKTLPEAGNWQADSQYQDRHSSMSSSIGEQASQPRTVPMIPTCISYAMRQASNVFVCTPYATLMR